MSKHIVKVDRSNGGFRIYVPRAVVLEKKWGGVRYITIEDNWGDKLLLRRLFDESMLDTDIS